MNINEVIEIHPALSLEDKVRLKRQIERLSEPVSDEECFAFERSYGEKLMLNFVDYGLSEFIASRASLATAIAEDLSK